MSSGDRPTVLHYVGGDDDRGGIVSVVRALAGAGRFACLLGVNPGFQSRRAPPLPVLELPRVTGESIGWRTMWQARAVARAAREWLRAEPDRVFHGRSRAGLLAALWLEWMGERRVVASVHCLGRQRWFYRWAAGRLRPRLVWLGPAMKGYYGVGDASWAGCVPDCVVFAETRARPVRAKAEVRCGCVGTLVPVKQWELVLRALARVPAAVSLRMIHAGAEDGTRASADYAAYLKKLADELGVAARVEWRGQVDDMAGFFSDVDCVVVAARREASSVAALEAAAAGMPVLASDAAGTRDLVETAGCGGLFRADDADDLAAKLQQLAAGGAFSCPDPARERLQPFSAPAVARQWEEIYAQLSAGE